MERKKAIRRLINTFGKSELMALLKGHRWDDDAETMTMIIHGALSLNIGFGWAWDWAAKGEPGLGNYPDYPWPQFKC